MSERPAGDDFGLDPEAQVAELFLDDRNLYGCAESAFNALMRAFRLSDADDASAAMALNGGIAYSGSTCGAITGAAMAIGLQEARQRPDHAEAKRAARLRTAALLRGFEAEFGATTCRALTGVDISTDQGHQAFIDSGAWRVGCLKQLQWTVARAMADDGEEPAAPG